MLSSQVQSPLLADPFHNVMEVLNCFTFSCGPIAETDSGFGFAFLIMLGLSGFGIFWFSALFSGLIPAGIATVPIRRLVMGGMALFWFWLCFGYAVPHFWGSGNYVGWSVAVPLFTALLMLGVLAMAALVVVVLRSIVEPGVWLPSERPGRAVLLLGVVAVLVGWRYLYTHEPQVSREFARGPFEFGPGWVRDSLEIWALRWPVEGAWRALDLFTDVTPIAVFGALSLLAVLLPLDGGGVSGAMATLPLRLVGSAATVVVAVIVSLVVGFIAFAIAVLVLFVAMIYFLYVAMLVVFAAALIKWLVD